MKKKSSTPINNFDYYNKKHRKLKTENPIKVYNNLNDSKKYVFFIKINIYLFFKSNI